MIVVEAGPAVTPESLPTDLLEAMGRLYAEGGIALTRGRAPMQLLYGRALGGTSVVNSAICWRLPEAVHAEWVAADPALGDALPWTALDRAGAGVEADLGVVPTAASVAGGNNLLLARGADRLGLAHQPIRRNTAGCQGLARCNLGCPRGAKLSMDRSFLPQAVAHGARIVTSVQVHRLERSRGRVTAVTGTTDGGGRVRIEADRAVVVAAGAIGTPLLLLRSGLRQGPVGDRLQCHPGLAVAGRFADPVRSWQGATQGHEVTGLMHERIKIEALAFDPALLTASLDQLGRGLVTEVDQLAHWATWAAAVRTTATGTVRLGRHRPRVRFALEADDLHRVRHAVRVLVELFFAAGAVEVAPGVAGVARRVSDPSQLTRFEEDGPRDPAAYRFALSHLFGTCRMGTDPETSVVRPDFRHHHVDGLYVADASVFPSNLGVNPQISIMSMAVCCAADIVGANRQRGFEAAR